MSKAKTILFRADSSSTIGTGHIMRDLVLAQKYAKKGAKIIFATQELNGNINHKIDDAGFERVVVKNNSKKELARLIKKLSVDLLVIDHYGIGYKKEKYVKDKTGVKILSFDDTYEKHHCDILFNHNISAKKRKYKNLLPKYCKIKCGTKYTLIRDEFKNEKERKTIFLAMGGSDHSNISYKILKTIPKKYIINIVTTSANKNINKLKKYIKTNQNIKLHINSNKIAKLMKKSDLAIISPSVISHEVIYMNLPFIAIMTGNDQKDIYEYFKKSGFLAMESFNKALLLKCLKKMEKNLNIYKIKMERIINDRF